MRRKALALAASAGLLVAAGVEAIVIFAPWIAGAH